MRKLLILLLFASIFAFALDIQIPPYLKVLESTALPPILIQALFGEEGKQIENLEVVIVEGDKEEAMQFWQQTLPSKGWKALTAMSSAQKEMIFAFNRGKDILLIAPGTTPRQFLLVEAKGVKDIGILLGIVMKGLSNLATSLTEQKTEQIFPQIPPPPQAKLVLEARIPGKIISERLKKETGEKATGSAPPTAKMQKPPLLLQSILADVEEIYFREFQLPSRIHPRDVIEYFEGKLKEGGWQLVIKNVEPQPSFPYVLICALKGNYTIISLIPEYPNRLFHTLDEIILVGKK